MAKTNKFHVKKYDDENSKITVVEECKYHSPFIWFLINNGKLIFVIALLLSLSVFLIATSLMISNLKGSEIAYYETNGVVVEFGGSDESILNGLPITDDYANRIFDNQLSSYEMIEGAVIKIKEVKINNGVIVFYSDKTALVKYDDGTYMRVFPVGNDYGISEKGLIDRNAKTRKVTGEYRNNDDLGITLLYLSDGTVEVTKDDVTFFLRNSDLTSNAEEFYTNLSIISVPIKEEDGKTYYSNGVVKDGDSIIVDGKKYNVSKRVTIHDGIEIVYYENGYAEVIKDELSIMVEKSEHIVYDDNILEIVDNKKDNDNFDLKDVIDIKDINLSNENDTPVNYLVVLEETDDYAKHNVNRRLANQFIHFNVFVNNSTINNNILDDSHNLKGTNKLSGIDSKNNVYMLYEGRLEEREQVSLKLGMWIDYETITNDYMNSAFIGTVKVYVESLS